MGYRRAHRRRAHTRTNQDGSESYVKESYVQGHQYNRKKFFFDITGAADAKTQFLAILVLIWISSIILTWIGIFFDLEGIGWYSIVGFISLVIVLLSCNK